MTQRPLFAIGGLGEIAIRCADLGSMRRFYEGVIGLKTLSERPGGIIFFDLGAGVGGHTQVLALFAADAGGVGVAGEHAGGVLTGTRASLHHIALALTADDQQAACDWFDRTGRPYRVEEFDWIGWRGVFLSDPEGNTVELVAKVKEPQP
ncbi:VOC family protein [Roseobacter sp. HKCCA0434]|uniref:VOC family protein n=1 Tax=Roseobacter sp. HKCCA0434 TaxID=3079297 RepID=UPI002905CF11|nr:VOC family protein [Roseobacter sp. HKCCA0434]